MSLDMAWYHNTQYCSHGYNTQCPKSVCVVCVCVEQKSNIQNSHSLSEN